MAGERADAGAGGQHPAKSTVSVALCTYNGERHLQAQLDSLAAQSRLPDELVVQDDGSTDGTLAILDGFRQGAPFPVHVHRNPTTLGVARNFEAALAGTSGDLVFLCDQDDLWHPDKVMVLAKTLETAGADGAFCNARLVDEEGNPLGGTVWGASEFTARQRRLFTRDPVAVLLRRNRVTGMCLAVRRHVLDWTLPIPPRWKHDHWMALLIAARGRLVAVPETLVDYRQHGRAVIGARRFSARERLLRGVGATSSDQGTAAARLEELAARLAPSAGQGPRASHAGVLAQVQAALRHRRARATLPHSRFARLPTVLRLASSGAYRRHDSGLRTVAWDLLRPGR